MILVMVRNERTKSLKGVVLSHIVRIWKPPLMCSSNDVGLANSTKTLNGMHHQKISGLHTYFYLVMGFFSCETVHIKNK